MAKRMTVRQFLALGPNEQPSVMAAEALWNDIGDLKEEVARLEGELVDTKEVEQAFEALFEARCKLLEDTKRLGLCVCRQRDEAKAANAAKDVALRATKVEIDADPHRCLLCYEPTDSHCEGCPAPLIGAALSDTGKGWPEVRATALARVRTIEEMASRLERSSGGYSQQMAGHIRQACYAALAALEVK